jgi:hypothetical protein
MQNINENEFLYAGNEYSREVWKSQLASSTTSLCSAALTKLKFNSPPEIISNYLITTVANSPLKYRTFLSDNVMYLPYEEKKIFSLNRKVVLVRELYSYASHN